MRWLRRHFRRILALISSYAVGNAVFLGPEGLRQMAKSFETEIGPKLESAFPVKK